MFVIRSNMILVLRVYWESYVEDEICIFKSGSKSSREVGAGSNRIKKKCEYNCYFVSLFLTILNASENYRLIVTKYLIKRLQAKPSSRVRLKIVMHPGKHIIDSRWSDILNHLCYEKRELYTAMAWLSTLGGAFSALGDISVDYALVAGRISMHQFKIALRLGDPPTVARCRLFYALSLIQCGKLKQARRLIEIMYHVAVTQYPSDKRLQRMCLGIWNKLQYEWGRQPKHNFLKS